MNELAVIDVDGTLISGNSQHLLVWYLARSGILPWYALIQALWWFAKYRLRLIDTPDKAMNRVISIFKGIHLERVEQVLGEFYISNILPRIRKDALTEISRLKGLGKKVILLSSSVDILVRHLAESVAADGWIATELERVDSKLTGRICGQAVHGEKKYCALQNYANAQYESWLLDEAYGDHLSDASLFGRAKSPFAICPDPGLKKIAKLNGWPILNWK